MIVVLMGVSGCGKTTVGQALAADLGWPFFDARRLSSGGQRRQDGGRRRRSTDADRWPWLDRLAAEMAAINARGGRRRARVLRAEAGLPRSLRAARATSASSICKGDHDTIAARLAARSHRYMPPSLLASQFATLEEPADAIVVDVRRRHSGAGRADPDGAATQPRCRVTSARTERDRMSDDKRKPATRAVHLGADPHAVPRRGQHAGVPRDDDAVSRPSPTSSRRRAANTRASATGCTACRPSPTCRTRSRRSRARTRRSRCRRDSRRRRCRCWRCCAPAIMCSSPMPSTARRGASATTT